jgi:hypothetical protein
VETYIIVSFWMSVVALVINLIVLMGGDFPIVKKQTVGMKTAEVLIGGAFAVWAGFLIYA